MTLGSLAPVLANGRWCGIQILPGPKQKSRRTGQAEWNDQRLRDPGDSNRLLYAQFVQDAGGQPTRGRDGLLQSCKKDMLRLDILRLALLCEGRCILHCLPGCIRVALPLSRHAIRGVVSGGPPGYTPQVPTSSGTSSACNLGRCRDRCQTSGSQRRGPRSRRRRPHAAYFVAHRVPCDDSGAAEGWHEGPGQRIHGGGLQSPASHAEPARANAAEPAAALQATWIFGSIPGTQMWQQHRRNMRSDDNTPGRRLRPHDFRYVEFQRGQS